MTPLVLAITALVFLRKPPVTHMRWEGVHRMGMVFAFLPGFIALLGSWMAASGGFMMGGDGALVVLAMSGLMTVYLLSSIAGLALLGFYYLDNR